jgi:hypothetical protein
MVSLLPAMVSVCRGQVPDSVSWHQGLHQLAISDRNNHGSGLDKQMPQTEESSTTQGFWQQQEQNRTDQANSEIFAIPAYLIDLSR